MSAKLDKNLDEATRQWLKTMPDKRFKAIIFVTNHPLAVIFYL
ncbi:MAG TPA: hypothetical protein VF596_17745 [Pyrinomonadaceae bacterium]|jgi:hypothetical protein